MPIFFSWPDYQKDVVKMFLPQISSAQLDTEHFLLQLLHIWTGLFTKWVHGFTGTLLLVLHPS